MALQRYEVNVNVRVKRMGKWLSKPGETINENLTGCLQWYVVIGYETKLKRLTLYYKQHGVEYNCPGKKL
jgi:hypothetical protein